MRQAALWYADLITRPGALKNWQDKACTLPGRATQPYQVFGCPEEEDGH